MDINEAQATLQKVKKCKIPQSEIAKALKKDRSNINAKAKRGTELKLTEVQELEKYFDVVLTESTYNLAQQINNIETKSQLAQILSRCLFICGVWLRSHGRIFRNGCP